jgi:DNA-binding NarL/FixJ family response regulator
MLPIAVVDKYNVMRLGLSVVLQEHFKKARVFVAVDVTELCENEHIPIPDLVILGTHWEMPEKCFEIVRKLQKRFPNVPLIVYDGDDQHNLVISYLKLGVKGCLKASYPVGEITRCAEAVIMGGTYICSSLLGKLTKAGLEKGDALLKPFQLTSREFEIAKYLAQGMRVTLIAQTLHRKKTTISTTKKTILKKMGVPDAMELKKVLHMERI